MMHSLVLAVLVTTAMTMPQTDVDLIETARNRSNEAIAAHDVEGILAEIDTSFHVTAGSGRFIAGPAAMKKAFESQFSRFADAVYVRTPANIDVADSREKAFESGQWVGTWTTAEGPFRTGGSYAASWSKASGSWKIRSEIFVTMFCEGSACE